MKGLDSFLQFDVLSEYVTHIAWSQTIASNVSLGCWALFTAQPVGFVMLTSWLWKFSGVTIKLKLYRAVLSCDAVYYAEQAVSDLWMQMKSSSGFHSNGMKAVSTKLLWVTVYWAVQGVFYILRLWMKSWSVVIQKQATGEHSCRTICL